MPQTSKKLDVNQLSKYKGDIEDISRKLEQTKKDLTGFLESKNPTTNTDAHNDNNKLKIIELKQTKLKLENLKQKYLNQLSYNQFLECLQLDNFKKFTHIEIEALDENIKKNKERELNINRNQEEINNRLNTNIFKLESIYSTCKSNLNSNLNLIENILKTEDKLNKIRNTPIKDLKSELNQVNKEKLEKETLLLSTQQKNKELEEAARIIKEKLKLKQEKVKYLKDKLADLNGTAELKDGEVRLFREDNQEELQKICPWLENSIKFLNGIKSYNIDD